MMHSDVLREDIALALDPADLADDGSKQFPIPTIQSCAAGVQRDKTNLADLYRRLGRVKDAQKIEAEMRKLLAYADPDFPILVELKRLQKTVPPAHKPN